MKTEIELLRHIADLALAVEEARGDLRVAKKTNMFGRDDVAPQWRLDDAGQKLSVALSIYRQVRNDTSWAKI